MRIPFGKTSLFILACVGPMWAQQSSTEQPSAPPVSQTTPASDPSKGQPSPADTSSALDYLYNRKPQDGSVGSQALTAGQRVETKAIADDAIGVPSLDPETQARFQRYLGMSPVPQATLDQYFGKMKYLSKLLRDDKTFEAWKGLSDLDDYTVIDAGISRELANRIESIWKMVNAAGSLNAANDNLRKAVKTANANADLMSDAIMEKEIDYQRRLTQGRKQQTQQRSNNNAAPNGGVPMAEDATQPTQASMVGLEGKLQLTEEYLRSLELKAKIKLNEIKQQKMFDQTKTDFAEYISTLFNSGRLNHVVLAADFYRKVFQEGEYPVDMARQVNASLEINRDVQTSVDVFKYKVEKGQLLGATTTLTRAFLTSELNPAVLSLERPLKEQVAEFEAQLAQMRNLIEARDFGTLEVLLSKIRQSANDFDTTKATAIVNGVKLESKLHLGKAKLAAQQGDLKLAMEEFQAAGQAWPGNPALENNANLFFETQDVKNQSLTEFDRFVADQNYRGIFEKQLAFAPAIKGDAKREESFKKALEAVRDAEVASEKANTLMINGDVFGAWETIELASVNFPDDRKLNKMRADLSSRSAEFVASVNKARDAEGRNENGYSLTWYVNAQRQYPASQIANAGIDRLSKKVLGTN